MGSLEKKFEKRAGSRKKTTDPSCPPYVRRARRITLAILGRANCVRLNDSDGPDQELPCEEGNTKLGTIGSDNPSRRDGPCSDDMATLKKNGKRRRNERNDVGV